jgi:hypothetical protein
LTKIRGAIANLGGGPAGLGMERLKRQTLELTEHTKNLGAGFTGGSNAALGMAKSFGLATAGVVAMGAAAGAALRNIGEYSTKMQDLGQFSKRLGVDAADVKSAVGAFARANVDAETARKNIAGIATSMADIGRVNSQLVRDLMRGLHGENRGAMQAFIDDLKNAPRDIATYGNKIAEAAENVYQNNLARTRNPAQAAEAKANFLARLGVPNIDELRETLKGATDAQKAALEQRIADAGDYNQVTTEIGQSWGKISDAIHSLATPAATAALRALAPIIKDMAEGIESAVNTLRNSTAPAWLSQMGTDLKTFGDMTAGWLNSLNKGAEDAGKSFREWLGLKPEWLTTLSADADAMFKLMHESVAELGRLFREMLAGLEPPEWLTKLGSFLGGAQGAVHAAGEGTRAVVSGIAADIGSAIKNLLPGAAEAAPPLPALEPARGMAGRGGGAYGVTPAPKTGLWSKAKGLVGRQAGGPVDAGQPVLVGENGPELFRPDQSGVIVPSKGLHSATTWGLYGAGMALGASGAGHAVGRAINAREKGHSIGGVMAGLIPGAGLLEKINQDANTGHGLRSKLRALLGLEDPNEPAPWQAGGQWKRASGGPVTGGTRGLVGEKGPELFMPNAQGGSSEGTRLVAEQTHQMRELNASNEDQSTQLKALTEELAILNRSIEMGGGGGGGSAGQGGGAGGRLRMGGLGGLPGFGGGGGGGYSGGGGSSGGGGASGGWSASEAYTPSMTPDGVSASPEPAPQMATGGAASGKFAELSPRIMENLQKTHGLAPHQAAGLVGNLGAETGGFKHMQELKPLGGKGGRGWAQWTGKRRTEFEAWSKASGLDPNSYDANMGFLNYELGAGPEVAGVKRGQYTGVLNQLKQTKNVQEATDLIHKKYETPADVIPSLAAKHGIRPFQSRPERQRYAAMAHGMAGMTTPSPGSSGKPVQQLGGGHYPGDGHDHSNLEGDPSMTLGAGVSERVKEQQAQVARIRNQAIQPELKRQLESAALANDLQVEVFSGGQPKIGTSNRRTGSTRHDLGGAADVKLRDPKTGKLLDMRVPADRARMIGFTREAVAQGATGVGAGEGYMGANALHIGGGSKASWGGADWIEDARKAGERDKMQRARGVGTGTGRAMLDADSDRSITQKVEGTGSLKVDVNAPAGTKVVATGEGLFKKVETNRQTQMMPAAEGPGNYSASPI